MGKRIFDIRVRCSKEEKEKIIRKAALVGLEASAFLRLLGLKANVKTDKKAYELYKEDEP